MPHKHAILDFRRVLLLLVTILATHRSYAAATTPEITQGNPIVKVRLFHTVTSVVISTASEVQLSAGGKHVPLVAGEWQIALMSAKKPVQRFHVFAKTFRPGEEPQMQQYVKEWKAKGYDALPVLRGDRYETVDKKTLDGRQYWVSLARTKTEAEAQQVVKKLEAQETWAWIRAETMQPGSGKVTLRAASNKATTEIPAPLTLQCDKPIAIQAGTSHGVYSGLISIAIEPDGSLGVYESLPLEEYLAGVLPAEMPALWPAEALMAQAVAARSDVLEHLGFKHILEGFHFTASEGDREYAGFGGRQTSTDAAVTSTRGQVLVAEGHIVPAVFCADCGGWTENNENVWSSPPNAALRGVSDIVHKSSDKSEPKDIARWLGQRPAAYCAGDEKNFRWTRRYTPAQLTAFVNKQHAVGQITAIQPGDRGVSGRLDWVRVTGTKGSATIRKELPIRQAFGDLPSSMLIIKEERGPHGPTAWTFVGGGRGHGVGLCQFGARGMALKGSRHDAILQHYFTGSALAVVQ